MSAPAPTRRLLLALLALWLVAWFANLEHRSLVRPDEGRYAEIPREMAATGDWVTPRLNGLKYFEKPPLQYWATAAAFRAFGEHHWTARLWPALTGFLGLIAIWYAGTRLFGPAAGLYAALLLGSCLWYVAIGHILTLDMGVTFFMTLGLCGLLLAQRDGTPPPERRGWMMATAAALGCAVLSKGLIGLILPGAVIVLYMLFTRDFGLLRRLHLVACIVVFAAVTVPWFVAVSLANPEFPHFFFVHEHFERFLTKTHKRDQPWWFFLPQLAVGITPWLTVLGAWVVSAVRPHARPPGFRPGLFLTIWAVFIFVFFSVSGSKLPSYILPIFPALALLAGRHLALAGDREVAWHAAVPAVLAVAGLLAAPLAVRAASVELPAALLERYVPWLMAAAAALLAGALACALLAYKGRRTAAIVALAAGGFGMAQLMLSGHDTLSPSTSARELARAVQPHLAPGVPFYSVGTYEQTLPFYIRRTVTQVAFLDELSFGASREPHLWIPDMASFEQRWRSGGRALAIMNPETFQSLHQGGLPMVEIARNTRRVIVGTP